MRTIVVVLLLFSIICVCVSRRSMEFDFNRWKQLNVKLYDNKTVENEAYGNYVANKRAIDEHNIKYAKGEVTYARAINKYADWSIERKQRWLNGFVLNTTSKKAYEDYLGLDKHREADVEARLELPDLVDWRTLGYVTPVQDQGYVCASCWTFSTLGSLEGQLWKTKLQLKKLSEQNLLDCNKDEILGNWGCRGGFMVSAFEYILTHYGVVSSAIYPYKETEFPCRYNRTRTLNRITSYMMIEPGDEVRLQQSLAKVGPISVAMHGTLESLYSYSSGVYYDEQCSDNLNHAVLLVGYGTDPKLGDYWLIKNSWGTQWGEGGYLRLARNRGNHCGIANYIVYPIV